MDAQRIFEDVRWPPNGYPHNNKRMSIDKALARIKRMIRPRYSSRIDTRQSTLSSDHSPKPIRRHRFGHSKTALGKEKGSKTAQPRLKQSGHIIGRRTRDSSHNRIRRRVRNRQIPDMHDSQHPNTTTRGKGRTQRKSTLHRYRRNIRSPESLPDSTGFRP